MSGNNHLTIITDIDFNDTLILSDDESAYHSFLVFSQSKPTSCIFSVDLAGKRSHATIHIVTFITNNQKVIIDGKIHIGPDGEEASGRLLEEVIILGDYSHALTKPVLDINHNNVSASHGARVHRIDKRQLFYLNSKGLSESQAKGIIIEGMIEDLFEGSPMVQLIGHEDSSLVKDVDKLKLFVMQKVFSHE